MNGAGGGLEAIGYCAVRDKGYDKGCSDIWIAWGMILGGNFLNLPFPDLLVH